MNLNIQLNNTSWFHPSKWMFIAFITCISALSLHGQVPLSQTEIQAQLTSKGVSQAEVDAFLDAKGLTLNDLERLSAEEFIELDKEFDAFIAERNTAEKSMDNTESNPSTKILKATKPVDKAKPSVDTLKKSTIVQPTITRFGQQLFINNNFSLQTGQGLVPGTYVLDVGDEVAISIFGNSQMSGVYPIEVDGSIKYANGDRRVVVAGLTLNEARQKLERVFSRTYSFGQGQFNVNVIGARTISLNVYGEVKKPGGYLISAVNSPINVLANTGGITRNGSYRNIRLLKSDGKVQFIDLYKYLSSPDEFVGVNLSNNDIMHVPIASDVVILTGAVTLPLEYEIKPNETLGDVIGYAGGFKADANRTSIQVTRYENGERRIIDVNYISGTGKSFRLQNGDEIQVNNLAGIVENVVRAKGQINNEGNFELKNQMKLSDLVAKLNFNKNSRTDLALLSRKENDGTTKLLKVNIDEIRNNSNAENNLLLQNGDELLVWSLERFKDTKSNVTINGAVKYPGSYPYDDSGVKVNDIILFAGGLRRDASNVGLIYRKDPLNPNKIQYVRFNPIQESSSENSEIIMPFDSIIILQDQSLTDNYMVEIAGMVKSPGNFQYGDGMTVKDLIVLADGFNLSALTERVEVNRIIIENNKATEIKVATVNVNPDLASTEDGDDYVLQPFDKVFVRAVPEFELQNVIFLSGAVKYPGKYVLENKNEKLMSVIERAGGLTEDAFLEGAQLNRSENGVGQVIMNLEAANKSKRSKYNYILKNGDVISIPKKEDIVTLQSNTLYKRITTLADENGEINNTISIAYFPGKKADYYIKEFGGGFGETGDRKNVFVEHANGEVASTKNVLGFRIYPEVRAGSTIVIPEKAIKVDNNESDKKVDWTQLLNDSVAQAMSILTLLLLVERL